MKLTTILSNKYLISIVVVIALVVSFVSLGKCDGEEPLPMCNCNCGVESPNELCENTECTTNPVTPTLKCVREFEADDKDIEEVTTPDGL